MPILEALYDARRRTANQIYMLLIILLILSQDSSFNAGIHKLVRLVFWNWTKSYSAVIVLNSNLVCLWIDTANHSMVQRTTPPPVFSWLPHDHHSYQNCTV